MKNKIQISAIQKMANVQIITLDTSFIARAERAAIHAELAETAIETNKEIYRKSVCEFLYDLCEALEGKEERV